MKFGDIAPNLSEFIYQKSSKSHRMPQKNNIVVYLRWFTFL
jgi:hypothetical protein